MGRFPNTLDTGGHPEYSHCRRCREGRLHFVQHIPHSIEDEYECDLCGQPVLAYMKDEKWELYSPFVEVLPNEKKRKKTYTLADVIRKYKERCNERRKEEACVLPDDQRAD